VSEPTWLTPDEVRAVVFDHAGPFRRGYNEAQVDDFLDLVENSLESLNRVIAHQQRELDVLRHWDQDMDGDPAKEHARVSAEQLMNDARQYALETVRRADVTARQIEDSARMRAHRIVSEAGRHIAPQSAPGQDIAASAVEVGTRLAHIRDELTEEVKNFYRVIGRIHNESVGQR
jgi:DivIVA domain-containing protein